MAQDSLQITATARFRAGSAYELVMLDRLPPEEQMLLAELQKDPNFYGVLRPREGRGLSIRAVDKDTALLWLSLQSPGTLPSFVWAGDAAAVAKEVSLLVLDGVLEIEKENGCFVSGPAAAEILTDANHVAPKTTLAQLSLEALRYGQALRLEDPDQLTARLYGFGRQPITPAWSRALPDQKEVLRFLGVENGSEVGHLLAASWTKAEDNDRSGWIAWSNVDQKEARWTGPQYKLYISPAIDALPAAFKKVVASLSRHCVPSFKVGNNAAGLLRTDKLVAYFRDLEQLHRVAEEMTQSLSGIRPHGVPFSAEIAHEGLLSWGMDPPATETALSWQGRESWRLWVTRRLAAIMIAAQTNDNGSMPSWQFALERVRLMGVDVEQWTPSSAIW